MGYSGGVAVANRDDFKLDMSHFKEALHRRWPDIQIKDVFEGDIDFGMTIKGEFNNLVGSTIKQQQVGWWGGYDEFAEFCIWFRQYIPDQYQLLAWDKDANDFVVVSDSTTEEQFIKGLGDARFYFEIFSPANTRQTLRPIAEEFKQVWSESIAFVSPDEDGKGFWFLQAQQGRIDFDKGLISFDDSDLQFAAQFAVWCRSLLPNDQKLTVRGSYYPRPESEVKTELTSTTTEDELLAFLTKSFSNEKSS